MIAAHSLATPPCMLEYLEVVRPHLSRVLCSAEAERRLVALATRLPRCDLAGIEYRLDGREPQVDFVVRLPSVASGWPLGGDDEWQRVRMLADAVARRAERPLEQVRVVDLEFDLPGDPAASPRPAVFFELESSTWCGKADLLELGAAIHGNALAPAVARSLARACDMLPLGAKIAHLGAMLNRPGSGCRLVVGRLGIPAVLPYLQRLGWTGDRDAVASTLARLPGLVDSVSLSIDLAEEVAPRIGIECFLERHADRLARWSRLLESFVAAGLCGPAHAEAFTAWHGISRREDDPTRWPSSLRWSEQVLGSRAASFFTRFVSHLKLLYQADGSLALKGYHGLAHYFRARPAASEVSAIAFGDPIGARVEAIAARAEPLWDRIDRSVAGADPRQREPLSPAGERRLGRWTTLAAGGDERRLARRLQWDNVSLESVVPVLNGTVAGASAPSWTSTLRAMLAAVDEHAGADPAAMHRAMSTAHPLPFEHAMVPFLALAHRQLADHATLRSLPIADFVDERAWAGLERILLRRLVRVSERVLLEKLATRRGAGRSMLLRLGLLEHAPQRRAYEELVAELLSGQWQSLFDEYPVMARLFAIAIDLWVDASAEVLARFHADGEAIAEIFGCTAERIEAVEGSISDPHRGGRGTLVLVLGGGGRVVYKPRPLGLDRAWNSLLAWCRACDPTMDLATPTVVDRGEYGWAAFVSHEPCTDGAEVAAYYRRAGMLLALLYLVGANDCHAENVIASGAYPVLIDLETLLHPDAPPIGDETTHADSVLRIGFLPRWECREDTRHVIDLSGLGFTEGQRSKQRVWRAINTDDMHAALDYDEVGTFRNLPFVGAHTCRPEAHLEPVLAGFRAMYAILEANGTALASAAGPLAAFREQAVRFLFRGTRVYSGIIEHGLEPDALRDGADWGIAVERLAFAFCATQERPPAWPILRAELAALAQLDIPLFVASSTDRELRWPGAQLSGFFHEDAHGKLLARLRRFGPADLYVQTQMILATVETSVESRHAASIEPVRADGPDAPTSTSVDFGATADDIAALLHRKAIAMADDRRSWLGQIYILNSEQFQVNMVSVNLYDGTAGIGLFLAAHANARDAAPELRELAHETTGDFRRLVQRGDGEAIARIARRLGPGGALGMGSIVYSFTRMAALLGDPELVDVAHAIARTIDARLVAADDRYDVMRGSAGALLGLAALYQATEDQDVLERARTCGQHLLARQLEHGPFAGGWASAGETPMGGFSHGASGIAYALARLAAIDGDASFASAARRALACERRMYTPAGANVPDYFGARKDGHGGPAMVAWCHGAAGIALTRLGALASLGDAELADDARLALEATRRAGPGSIDHLCCGSFGRMEALLVGAEVLGEPTWLETARAWGHDVVTRAERDGGYRLRTTRATDRKFDNPPLFQGLAGIGYAALRLANPAAVPSVLSWQ